jgi:hypothetical protein
MKKFPNGTYAFDSVLRQLRKIAPDLIYTSDQTSKGRVFNGYLIAKNKTSFRPVGVLDWAHYTEAGIRTAIQHGVLDQYYEKMLEDSRSPTNVWKDKKKEQNLKEYYANRSGEIYE